MDSSGWLQLIELIGLDLETYDQWQLQFPLALKRLEANRITGAFGCPYVQIALTSSVACDYQQNLNFNAPTQTSIQ